MITLTKDFDYKRHAAWRSDPETLLWTRESNPTNESEQRRYLENLPKDKLFFAVTHQEHGHVGTAGLTDIDHYNGTVEFSLLIGREYQGKGFGSIALWQLLDTGFNDLNLNLIFGETFIYPKESEIQTGLDEYEHGLINPAIKLFNKLGFEKEGILKQRYWKFGWRVDTMLVSITRDQWKL